MKKLEFPPALVLFLLAPAIGELLSGSAPPAEFFTPFGFLMIVCLYGSGAVVIRELKTRWKKGIGSVLLLGAAYGVLEEALLVTSWFSPYWMDLGPMAVYGRWLDINWVWAEMLTIYHAVFSITIPIILTELAFSNKRNENWIGKKLLITLIGGLTALTIFGTWLFSTLMQYWTSLPQYLFAIILMITFIQLARRLPTNWGKHGQRNLPRPFVLLLVAAAADLAFFLGFYASPTLIPWQLTMLYGPLLIFLTAEFITRYNWHQKPTDIHTLALCSGALTFFLIFAPLQELDKTRTDNTQGMILVALATITALIILRHKIKQRNKTEPNKEAQTQPQPTT